MLAISTDNLRGAESIVNRVGIPFPVLYDPDADVATQYGVFDILRDSPGLAAPATFIIDRDGVITWKYVARRNTDRPSTARVMAQLRLLAH